MSLKVHGNPVKRRGKKNNYEEPLLHFSHSRVFDELSNIHARVRLLSPAGR